MLTTLALTKLWKPERRYLNKEFEEHAKAQDAALENDAEQYFRHQARAERYAERADRAHERHMIKESRYLKKEALEHRMAQESLNRGDTAGFAHHEYRAARYHNKAGRKHARKHYPAPPGHSHHNDPYFRGDMPMACGHEEVPMGALGGVPPLGTAPVGIMAGTVPVSSTLTSTTTASLAPPVAVPPEPFMGTMGGYTEDVIEPASPYYAPPMPQSLPPRMVRDFEVVEYDTDFIPTGRPLGFAPEFRRVGTGVPPTYIDTDGYW